MSKILIANTLGLVGLANVGGFKEPIEFNEKFEATVAHEVAAVLRGVPGYIVGDQLVGDAPSSASASAPVAVSPKATEVVGYQVEEQASTGKLVPVAVTRAEAIDRFDPNNWYPTEEAAQAACDETNAKTADVSTHPLGTPAGGEGAADKGQGTETPDAKLDGQGVGTTEVVVELTDEQKATIAAAAGLKADDLIADIKTLEDIPQLQLLAEHDARKGVQKAATQRLEALGFKGE